MLIVVTELSTTRKQTGAWMERPTTERPLNISTQTERPLDIWSTVTFHTCDNWTESGRIVRPPQKRTFRPKIWGEMSHCDIATPCNKASLSCDISVLCYNLSWCVLWPIFPINRDILSHGNILTWCILSSLFPYCNIFSHCNILFMVWHLVYACGCVCVCVCQSPPTHG